MKIKNQLTKLIKEKINKIDKRDMKKYEHYAITLAVDEDRTGEEEKDNEDKTEEKDSRKEDKTEDAENFEIKLEPVIENTDPIAVNLEEEGTYTLEICNEIDCSKQAIFVDHGYWALNSITIPNSGIRYAEKKLRKKMKKELIQPESESIIHTSRQSHKCPMCDFVFTRKDSQKEHMKLKHGEKPKNQCWLCLKAHGKKIDLKRHIHTKHNDFECPFCTAKMTEAWQYDEFKEHFEQHQKALGFEWRKIEMEESKKLPSFHDLCPFKG